MHASVALTRLAAWEMMGDSGNLRMRVLLTSAVAFLISLSVSARDGGRTFASGAPGTIDTIAGGVAENVPATSVSMYYPDSVAVDSTGDLYIADGHSCRVRKITNGTIVTVAGNGTCAFSGDGGPAMQASLKHPTGVAVDGSGTFYIADGDNCRIRRVTNGIISTIAGSGDCADGGSGGPALSTPLYGPAWIAVDGGGNVYVSESAYCRVYKITSGMISTIAGTGVCAYDGDGGPATSASVDAPTGLTFDAAGDLYFADANNCVVREVVDGVINTIVGNGSCGYSGDGASAIAAQISQSAGVAIGNDGAIYISDGYSNCRVRKVIGGVITTLAGTGLCTYSGDGGPAVSASLHYPLALAVDNSSTVFVADEDNCRIRAISGGNITTVAGNGWCAYDRDGGPATSATLANPFGVALSTANDVYFSDSTSCLVRRLTAGTISTVAGSTCGFSGDGGPATSASLYYPDGIAVSASGDLYIADALNCRIRKVSAGTITTVAGGGGPCGYSGGGGDGGAATNASLYNPFGVAVSASNDLYIADTLNCRIRRVTGGTISTVAGNGFCGYSGDGGPATSARLNQPQAVTLDGNGDLYISDSGNCRLRKVTFGTITTVAGNGICGNGTDGVAPKSSALFISEFTIDQSGNIYIAADCRVREISLGSIWTVAGSVTCGDGGNGGPALNALLDGPAGLAVDGSGNLYLADDSNHSVREVFGIVDADSDGCPDYRETGGDYRTGGQRDPNSPWDFFDVPTPSLSATNSAGGRNRAVSIADVIAILTYIGTSDGGVMNSNGVSYNSDLNINGVADGREYDRTPSTDMSQPWRSGPPNGAVTIGDALVALNQVGDNCN